MEDIELIETIEKYLTDSMSSQERTQFETLRKNTPEIDQMVVEHCMFLHEMNIYANRTNFSKVSESTEEIQPK
jgi:hypothetical protein